MKTESIDESLPENIRAAMQKLYDATDAVIAILRETETEDDAGNPAAFELIDYSVSCAALIFTIGLDVSTDGIFDIAMAFVRALRAQIGDRDEIDAEQDGDTIQ